MKKIVFISHDASRTGAPIALIRLMTELKKQRNVSVTTLLPYDGPLRNDFAKLGPVFIWSRQYHLGRFYRLAYRVLKLISLVSEKSLNKRIIKTVADADLVFVNTMTNHRLLTQLPLKGKRVFTYIHESKIVASANATGDEMRYLESISEKIYLPTLSAADYLAEAYHFPKNKLHELPAIVVNGNIQQVNREKSPYFNVGLCGVFGILKGADMLPRLAQILITKGVDQFRLHWIGTDLTSTEFLLIEEDINKLGLNEYFSFYGRTENVHALLSTMDLFLLLSREDTFPLVVLEAACHSIPTVCFKSAGGIQNFVQDDAGICVEYLDLEQVATAIETFIKDPGLLMQKGQKAREKVQRHLDGTAIVDALWKDIENADTIP